MSASIELLERADDQLRRIVSRLSPAQAALPTPCSEFNLRMLVNDIVYDQHTSDVVVHAWDVARATASTDELDPELAQAALAWGRQNLKPELRGQAFGPEIPVAESAAVYDRLAGFFGRTPG